MDPPRGSLARPALSVLHSNGAIKDGAIIVRDAMELPLLFNGPGIARERVFRAASSQELNKVVRRACLQGKTSWVAFDSIGRTEHVFEQKLTRLREAFDRHRLGG